MTPCRALGVGLASAILVASVVVAAPAGAAAPRGKSGCAHAAYVANFGAGTVSVVDTKTGKVTGTITVGSSPYGVAFSPDGSHAYVTNHLGNSVSVIETRTRTVTATIPVGIDPWSIAITPDAKHVYTANDGGPSQPATVSDITTKTATVKEVDGAAGASAVSVRPTGAQAYTAGGLGIVTVIDTQTGTLLQTPSGTPAAPTWPNGTKLGGFNAEEIRFSPDGTRAYATTNSNGSLVVIDTQTRAVLITTKVGSRAIGLAITHDGRRAYVVTDGGVVVVDTTTGVVSSRIAVGPHPQQVAIALDGNHAYVTGGLGAPTLSVIDTKTGAVTGTVAVGAVPMGVAICSAGGTRH